MKLDRIFKDLIDFVHRLLWHRQGRIKEPPYMVLKGPIKCRFGMLQRIRRRPIAGVPDRDIAYWIYMPTRFNKSTQEKLDVHVSCTTLEILSESSHLKDGAKVTPKKRTRRPSDPTHRIEVFAASHWVGTDGRWDLEQIYTGDFNFQGNQDKMHLFAAVITEQVVLQLQTTDPRFMKWAQEIQLAQRIVMGIHYVPPPGQSQSSNPINIPISRRLKPGENYQQP